MNIISILRSFLSPDQLVMHADPTRYTPLATVDAHRSDAGAIQPARADILSQFYPSREDDSALVRAFKVLTDVGEEINNLQQELERVKHSKHEFDRINNKLKIAHLKHVEAASSYRYVKTNSIDLMTAFSEYDQAPSLFKRDILWSVTRRTIETIIKIESALKELVAAKWELQIEPIVEEPLGGNYF